MKTKILLILSLFGIAMVSTGCAQLMGGLRRDLDDSEYDSSPTVGGRWSEGGHLSENMGDREDDRYMSVGHTDRRLAGDYNDNTGTSWVNERHAEMNRADRNRFSGDENGERDLSYSNTPSLAPAVKRLYKNGARATRADFIDEGQSEGSLWASDGQTNYYFTKNKIRGVGDIVSMNIENDLLKDMATEVGRSLTPREKEREIELAQLGLSTKPAGAGDDKNKDQLQTSAASAQREPAAEDAKTSGPKKPDAREASWSDVDMTKTIETKVGDTMMAEIVERYPNGNYKIRGTKKVRYRNSYRYVNLLGVVKGTDISEEDQVASGKLYEYQLEAAR